MVARYKAAAAEEGGSYFTSSKVKFISSGCTTLDCAVGGWPLGRCVNIVGDKAVGKTLLAIEAAANFARQYPKGKIWYRESEAAFDVDYAASVGLPKDRVDFGPEGEDTHWDTVEDVFEDLQKCLSKARTQPGLYIVDSLDALSSREEMKRDINAGSFKLEKQKVLGELFRRHIRNVKKSQVCFMVISQVRDRIGVVFGDKHTRTGGKALDFYASQIVWLSNLGPAYRKVNGMKRAVGVHIRARGKKNKVGVPFRECEFIVRGNYGIDDLYANAAWLYEVDRLDDVPGIAEESRVKSPKDFLELAEQRSVYDQEFADRWREPLRAAVLKYWPLVEKDYQPIMRKYG